MFFFSGPVKAPNPSSTISSKAIFFVMYPSVFILPSFINAIVAGNSCLYAKVPTIFFSVNTNTFGLKFVSFSHILVITIVPSNFKLSIPVSNPILAPVVSKATFTPNPFVSFLTSSGILTSLGSKLHLLLLFLHIFVL